MGAAMAPAVFDTIASHLSDTGRTAADYDLIATGDLGWIGRELLLSLAQGVVGDDRIQVVGHAADELPAVGLLRRLDDL